jgi:hypothetical protein
MRIMFYMKQWLHHHCVHRIVEYGPSLMLLSCQIVMITEVIVCILPGGTRMRTYLGEPIYWLLYWLQSLHFESLS